MRKLLEKYDILEWLLGAMVVGEVLLLAYYNLATDYIYDQDAAKAIYHTIKIWENGALHVPGWDYMTTGEWDSTMFLAILLYGITGNITLSYAIGNIINIVLFIFVVYTLLTSVGVKNRSVLLALSIILVPYGWGMLEYTNMLFYSIGQYVYKVLTPLCMLAVYHYKDRFTSRGIYYTLLFVLSYLIFLTVTSSGAYVIVCGLLAIWLTRGIYLLVRNERPHRDHLMELALALAVIAIALYLHIRWGVSSSADSRKLFAASGLSENLNALLVGLLSVFHILPEKCHAFSREGLTSVVKIPLVTLLLIYGLSNIKRTFCLDRFTGLSNDTRTDDRYLIQAELISIFALNSLFVFLTTPVECNRYLLIGVIPFILLAIITFDDKCTSVYLPYLLLVWMIVVNAFVQYDAYVGVKSAFGNNYSKEICQDIIDEARQEGVSTIVFYDCTDWCEMVRAYAPDLEVITYRSEYDEFRDYDIPNTVKDVSYVDDKDCMVVIQGDPDMESVADFVKNGYTYQCEIDQFTVLASDK